MKSRRSAGTGDLRHGVPAPAIGGAKRAGVSQAAPPRKAKMFIGVSGKEQPPCTPSPPSFITVASGEGFLFNHQFLSSLSNLGLEHLAETRQRRRGCDWTDEPHRLIETPI